MSIDIRLYNYAFEYRYKQVFILESNLHFPTDISPLQTDTPPRFYRQSLKITYLIQIEISDKIRTDFLTNFLPVSRLFLGNFLSHTDTIFPVFPEKFVVGAEEFPGIFTDRIIRKLLEEHSLRTRFVGRKSPDFSLKMTNSPETRFSEASVKTHKIEVTQSDIYNGVAVNCTSCPIALALQRHFGVEMASASVFDLITYKKDGQGRWLPHKIFDTPYFAASFIRRYDDRLPVHPFTFELTERD